MLVSIIAGGSHERAEEIVMMFAGDGWRHAVLGKETGTLFYR